MEDGFFSFLVMDIYNYSPFLGRGTGRSDDLFFVIGWVWADYEVFQTRPKFCNLGLLWEGTFVFFFLYFSFGKTTFMVFGYVQIQSHLFLFSRACLPAFLFHEKCSSFYNFLFIFSSEQLYYFIFDGVDYCIFHGTTWFSLVFLFPS